MRTAAMRMMARQSSAFNPLTAISWKAAFWAEDPSWTNPGDGGSVSTWRNGGSSGGAATQAIGTKRPTFRASTAAFGNRSTVQFDGGDILTTGNLAQPQPFSHVVVAQWTATGGYAMGSNDSGAAGGIVRVGRYNVYFGVGFAGATLSDANPHLLNCYANGASSTLYLDGTLDGSGNAGTRAIGAAALTIGAYQDGTAMMTGHIAFAGLYNGSVIADGQWATFKGWVSAHYGLAIA